MNSLLLILALTCPNTNIINKTNEWNADDEWHLNTAKKRCGEIYEDAPCLKIFTKKDKTTYSAICGEKQ